MGKFLDWIKSAPVEWKPLGEVVNVVTAPSKAKRLEYAKAGVYPVIDQGIEFISGYVDATYQPIPKGEYVLFGDHSEHVKYVDFAFVQGADGLKILKPIQCNAKYVYYSLANFYIKKAGYKRHWSDAKETLIPIPPMEVQEEIVRILDKFTELIVALNKELELRRKQYDYYLHHLLTFDPSEIPFVSLCEMTEIKRGKRLVRKQLQMEGSYAVFQNSMKPLGYYHEYNVKRHSTFIICAGSAGDIGYSDEDFWAADDVTYFVVQDKLNSKFLYYFLKTKQDLLYSRVRREDRALGHHLQQAPPLLRQ